jgi:hypothetical protein
MGSSFDREEQHRGGLGDFGQGRIAASRLGVMLWLMPIRLVLYDIGTCDLQSNLHPDKRL